MTRTISLPAKLCLLIPILLLLATLSSTGQMTTVWPGDTNLDGVVTNDDLLNIGLAIGAQGPPRPGATLQFQPQPTMAWNIHLPVSGIDYAHLDCDGNGVIDEFDAIAIEQNYLLMQNQNVVPQISDTLFLPGPAEARFELDQDTVGFGDPVMLRVILESPVFSVQPTFPDTVYGVALTVNYDVSFTKDDTTTFSFTDTWLGEPGNSIPFGRVRNDTLPFAAKSALVPGETGKVDLAKVRTDSTNKKGSGEEFGVCIVMDENIFKPAAGGGTQVMPLVISISDVRMISLNERIVPVVTMSDTIYVMKTDTCNSTTEVQNLSESNLSVTSVTLNWDVVQGAAGYEIRGGLASLPPSSFVTLNIPDGTVSSFDVTGLQPGTSYQWLIIPICGNGISGIPSPIRVFTTDNCQPPIPIFTNVNGPTEAVLHWNFVNGAFGYQIVGGLLGSPSTVTLNLADPLQTAFLAGDLIPGQAYQWQVRAACGSLNKLFWSPFSNQEVFSTPPLNPPVWFQKGKTTDEQEFHASIAVNPGNHSITVHLENARAASLVELYDLSGRCIYSELWNNDLHATNAYNIALGKITSGVYILKIRNAGHEITDKLFIVN